jgi:hypothetical protein
VGDSKGGGVDQGSGSGDPGGGIGSGGLQSHQQSADYARSLLPCMCARGCEREPQCPNSVSKHKLGGRVAASKIGGGPFGTSMAVKTNADNRQMPWPARSKIKLLSDSPWPRPRWSGRSPGSRPRIMTRLQSGSADFFPRHAVEASGRASQFSKSPKRWAVSLARLLAVRAAVRGSPGEPEGTGGCFSAFPTRLVGGAQATLQLRLQPLQMAGRTDKSFQNRAVIFDFRESSKRPDLVSVVYLPTGRGALSAGASRVGGILATRVSDHLYQ